MSNKWSAGRIPQQRSWREEDLLVQEQMVAHQLPMEVVANEVATDRSPFDLVDDLQQLFMVNYARFDVKTMTYASILSTFSV
jgi:hypothetical protein